MTSTCTVVWSLPPLQFFSSFLSPSQFIFAISPSFLLIGPLLYFPSLLFLSRPFPFPNLSLYLLTHAPPWMSLSPSFLFHRFPVPSLPIPSPPGPYPLNPAVGAERCKFSEQVPTKPGRQIVYGAFWVKIEPVAIACHVALLGLSTALVL